MDGGRREVEERKRMKAAVKSNFRRQTVLRSRLARQASRRESRQQTARSRSSTPIDDVHLRESSPLPPEEAADTEEGIATSFTLFSPKYSAVLR